MKIVKIVLVIIALLLVVAVSVYTFYSGFSHISVKIETVAEEVFVYENIEGDYSKTEDVIENIYDLLSNELNIQTSRFCAIYYDDSRILQKSDLRSEAGCLIDNKADSIRIKQKLSQKLEIKILPDNKYVTVEFPFKGPLSTVIGTYKAYPAIDKYLEENRLKSEGPMLETYDMVNKKIYYRRPLSKDN